MPRFLFIDTAEQSLSHEHCLIINAATAEKARAFLTEREANADGFLTYLSDRAPNSGFLSQFYCTTDEEDAALMESGKLVDEVVVIDRIRDFFGVHEPWASLYLAYFDGPDDLDGRAIAQRFPYDMRLFILENSSWHCEWDIIELDKVRVVA